MAAAAMLLSNSSLESFRNSTAASMRFLQAPRTVSMRWAVSAGLLRYSKAPRRFASLSSVSDPCPVRMMT